MEDQFNPQSAIINPHSREGVNVKVAIGEYRYSEQVADNFRKVVDVIEMASEEFVSLICFPELFIGPNLAEPIPNALTNRLCFTAKRNQIHLVSGNIRAPGQFGKTRQVSLAISEGGIILGQQEKLLPYPTESGSFVPGSHLKTINTPLGNLCILCGAAVLDRAYREMVNRIKPEILVLQYNFRNDEERETIKSLALEISKDAAPLVLAPSLSGDFYQQSYVGGGFIVYNGRIVARAGEEGVDSPSVISTDIGDAIEREELPEDLEEARKKSKSMSEIPTVSYVVGIVGSMKKEGADEILLREAMRGAEDLGVKTEIINLSDVDFSFCDECLRCWDEKRCVTYEDMQRVLSKMTLADAMIIATHTSNLNVTSIVKSFFEICINYAAATDAFKGKRGGVLVTSAEGEEKGFVAEALSVLSKSCAIRMEDELSLEIGEEINERDRKRAFNLGAKVVRLPETSLKKEATVEV